MTSPATAYLAARSAAHATRLDMPACVHAAFCDCGCAPTYCTRCDRDVEGSDALTFCAGAWLCEDCCDEGEA